MTVVTNAREFPGHSRPESRNLWNCNSRRFFYLRARKPAALDLFLALHARPVFHVPYVTGLSLAGSPYSAEGTVYEIPGTKSSDSVAMVRGP